MRECRGLLKGPKGRHGSWVTNTGARRVQGAKGFSTDQGSRAARCTLCALQPSTRGKALGLCQDGRMDGPPAGGVRGSEGRGALWCGVAWRARACVDGTLYSRALRAKGVPGGGGCGGHNTIRGLKGGREGRNAGNVLGWPRRCELLMHSCGNTCTAIKG